MTKNAVKPVSMKLISYDESELEGKKRTYHKAEQPNPGGGAVKHRTVQRGGKSRSEVGSKRDQSKDNEKYNRQHDCDCNENWGGSSWRIEEVWGILRKHRQVYIAIDNVSQIGNILSYRMLGILLVAYTSPDHCHSDASRTL